MDKFKENINQKVSVLQYELNKNRELLFFLIRNDRVLKSET
jgi:hypothetical protein